MRILRIPWPTVLPSIDDQWMTVAEIARWFRVKPGTVRLWIRRGHVTLRRGKVNLAQTRRYLNQRGDHGQKKGTPPPGTVPQHDDTPPPELTSRSDG